MEAPLEELTRRQLWFTVGNSISVDVVAADAAADARLD